MSHLYPDSSLKPSVLACGTQLDGRRDMVNTSWLHFILCSLFEVPQRIFKALKLQNVLELLNISSMWELFHMGYHPRKLRKQFLRRHLFSVTTINLHIQEAISILAIFLALALQKKWVPMFCSYCFDTFMHRII